MSEPVSSWLFGDKCVLIVCQGHVVSFACLCQVDLGLVSWNVTRCYLKVQAHTSIECKLG